MKFTSYTKYVASGIDWLDDLPIHWEKKKIKWLFEIKKRIAGELGYDVLSITQRGIVVKDTESGDGQLSMDYSKYQIVEAGDFAMNHMDLLTGYVDISKFYGVTSPDYRVFSVREVETCQKQYFLYLFQMAYKNKIFYPFGQGSSQLGRWRLPTDAFNEFVLPVPPYAEQVSISSFLDCETAKIDALIAKQEELIELLKEKRQAVISHAVTKGLDPTFPMKPSGVEWLGDVPRHWTLGALKRVMTLVGRIGFRGYTTEDLVEEGEGAITLSPSNMVGGTLSFNKCTYISWHKYDESPEIKLEEGDVVIVKTGSTLGKVAFVDALSTPATINPQLAICKQIKVNKKFLFYLLSSDYIQAHIDVSNTGGTIPTMTQESINNYVAAFPEMDEQAHIVAHLDEVTIKIDALIEKAEHGIRLQKEHRTALISAAVTGKIDVRDTVTDLQEAA